MKREAVGIADALYPHLNLNKYLLPVMGYEPELLSLQAAAKRRRDIVPEEPPQALQDAVVETCINEYDLGVPLPFAFPGGVFDPRLARVQIDHLIDNDIKLKSTPGLPYCYLGGTNASVVASFRDLIVNATLERLELLATTDITKLSAMELLYEGACDPIRVFIKNEPHLVAKVLEGRQRLISAVSLIDNLIERVLNTRQSHAEIDNWLTIPSKPGIGLTDDLAMMAFRKTVFDKIFDGKAAANSDMRGWDISVPEVLPRLYTRVKIGLFKRSGLLGDNSQLQRAYENRMYCFLNPMYCPSNGGLYRYTRPGAVISGSYITSSGGSMMRVIASKLAGADWQYTMGDDCVEEYVEGAFEKYVAMGLRPKFYSKCVEKFDFCSYDHVLEASIPNNPVKTIYNALQQASWTDEFADQFTTVMRSHPECEAFLSIIEECHMLAGSRA